MATIREVIETSANTVTHAYTRVYLVDNDSGVGNNTHLNAPAACQADDGAGNSIPVEGDEYPSDPMSKVSSVQAEPFASKEGGRWRVTVNYTKPAASTGPGDLPWGKDELWSVTPGQLSKQATKNYAEDNDVGKPLANTAGQSIDIGYLVRDPVVRISGTKSYLTSDFNAKTESAGVGTINSSAMSLAHENFDALTVLYESFTAAEAYHTDNFGNVRKYWTVTRNYVVRPDTWDFKVLNTGTVELNEATAGTGKSTKVLRNANREIIAGPVPLDPAGKAYRDAKNNIISPDTPHYLDVRPYKTGI